MLKIKLLSGIGLLILSIVGCYNDKEELLYPTANANDCSNPAIQKGPKFTAVESIINSKCVLCHNGNESPNLTTACNIVNEWSDINYRCVVLKNMPQNGPLPTTEQDAITAWVNAGHKYTD
jgi:uncharacterized membrane protein